MNDPLLNDVDTLLGAAFDRALSDPSVDLVETVMDRIRRRQRVRLVVLGSIWVIAAVIAAVSALPVLTSLETVLSHLQIAHWQPGLPALAGVAGACIFGGWLLLEEPA